MVVRDSPHARERPRDRLSVRLRLPQRVGRHLPRGDEPHRADEPDRRPLARRAAARCPERRSAARGLGVVRGGRRSAARGRRPERRTPPRGGDRVERRTCARRAGQRAAHARRLGARRGRARRRDHLPRRRAAPDLAVLPRPRRARSGRSASRGRRRPRRARSCRRRGFARTHHHPRADGRDAGRSSARCSTSTASATCC